MLCRSLKQLRKEVADRLARKAAAKAQAGAHAPPPTLAPTPAGLYESESEADMSPGPVSYGHFDTKEVKVLLLTALIVMMQAAGLVS